MTVFIFVYITRIIIEEYLKLPVNTEHVRSLKICWVIDVSKLAVLANENTPEKIIITSNDITTKNITSVFSVLCICTVLLYKYITTFINLFLKLLKRTENGYSNETSENAKSCKGKEISICII